MSTFDKIFLGTIALAVGMILFPVVVYVLRVWWKLIVMAFKEPV